jgi:hypothetical protein
MRVTHRRRAAFKLSELVIVIILVVLGVGILGPSLLALFGGHGQGSAAARTQCVNNLKQLGLAIHNYANQNQGALPALTSDAKMQEYGAYNGGIFFTLLPYLEQEQLFGHAVSSLPTATWYAPIVPIADLPFGKPNPDRQNVPIAAQALKVYQCPADATIVQGEWSENQQGSMGGPGQFVFPWAGTSYAANYQVFGTENDLGNRKSGNYCAPKYKLAKIPDGMSNTVFFGEQMAACGSSAGNLWAYPGIGNYSAAEYTSEQAGCHPLAGVNNNIVNTADKTNSKLWAPVFANSNAIYGFTAGGDKGSIYEYNSRNTNAKPLMAPYEPLKYWDAPPQVGIMQSECDKSRLQSFHTGVVAVGLGDGSVKLVSSGVSQKTWHSAIMPADGTPLGADW